MYRKTYKADDVLSIHYKDKLEKVYLERAIEIEDELKAVHYFL